MGPKGTIMGLFTRKRYERAGFLLYKAAVGAARDPWFYEGLGVPDTLDGRFDLVGVHVFLVIDRLRAEVAPGPAVAQAVFDAMFADMDFNLREMGVGDMSVSKRMKEMWEAFHGRAEAYGAALAAEPAELSEALRRNVWRGAAPDGAAEALADLVRRQKAALAAVPVEQFAKGELRFLPAGLLAA
jgi:cytochrome b pre-mRNA-processing protein 3